MTPTACLASHLIRIGTEHHFGETLALASTIKCSPQHRDTTDVGQDLAR
jgi:hypothetical protein